MLSIIRERLTQNATEFDQIVMEIIEYTKNLETQNKEYKDTIDIMKNLLEAIKY